MHEDPPKTGGGFRKGHAVIYTCPMHAEIRQRGPGSCPKCGMTLELLLPAMGEEQDEREQISKAIEVHDSCSCERLKWRLENSRLTVMAPPKKSVRRTHQRSSLACESHVAAMPRSEVDVAPIIRQERACILLASAPIPSPRTIIGTM